MTKTSPVRFGKRWHRACFAIFCASWTAMLIPPLIVPTSAVASIFTLALLGIGVLAVMSLIVSAILTSLYSTPTAGGSAATVRK
jgi:hypothetical protein